MCLARRCDGRSCTISLSDVLSVPTSRSFDRVSEERMNGERVGSVQRQEGEGEGEGKLFRLILAAKSACAERKPPGMFQRKIELVRS